MAGSWLHPENLTADQRRNVATIIAVGKRLGASSRDITIALMAAAQESEFKNIAYGDRAGPDSRGLFQQRAPWGTLADRMNPAKAAAMFFTGGHTGQRGLFDFKNRESLSLTHAAQAVQVSAYPDAYAKHESLARALLGSAPAAKGSVPEQAPVADASARPTSAPVVTMPDSTHTTTKTTTLPGAPLPPIPGTPVVQAALAEGTTPGAAAATSPGAGAATAPGGQAATAPSWGDLPAAAAPAADPLTATTTTTTTSPGSTTHFPTVDRATFHDLFPDAAGNAMFNGQTNAAPSGRRQDALTTAMSYLGTPYVWGGNGRSGVDCSGLVQQVYKSMGIDLPRLSADQARAGVRTSLSRLRPGDLVAMDNSSRNNGADHIAIWAGNGYIIEAPRPGLHVRKRKIGANERGWFGVHFAALG